MFTGIITTKEILDREFKASYSLFAEAKDQGSLPRSTRVPILIKVTDVNDNPPEIIDPREDVVSVREEQHPGAEVARVKAIDRDNGVNSTITYSILNERDMDGFGVFVIDPSTGVIKTSTGKKKNTYSKYLQFYLQIFSNILSLLVFQC